MYNEDIMKSKLLRLLKSKTFWAWFFVILIIVVVTCFGNKPSVKNLKSESNPGINIIQAKLVDVGVLSFADLPKLYEGTLTFENLNDRALHTYFVCLENKEDIKLNAIYDLPANYYIVPEPDPSISQVTAGCNRSLHLSYSQDANIETSAPTEIQGGSLPVTSIKQFDWSTVPNYNLNEAFCLEGCIHPDSKNITIMQTIDLTGDGKNEAIVRPVISTAIYYILNKNSDGSISVLKQKNQDGTTSLAELNSHGGTEINSDYELIPEEHGFYSMTFVKDEKRSTADKYYYNCNSNSINAYAWNPSSSLFEWNQALTAKYIKYTEQKLKLSCS